MAKELFYSPLTREQYEEGRQRRLHPYEIENGQVVTSPRISHPEDRIGSYAVEFFVEILFVEPNNEIFDVGLWLLDADGQRVSKKRSDLKDDGIIYNPNNPSIEGYFLAATDKLGLGPLAVNETLTLSR